MSKTQDLIDKLLPAAGVVVKVDFLREPAVIAFFGVLKYRDSKGKDIVTVMKEMDTCTNYMIWCSIANDQHPFGPTLTIRGEGDPGKITIPWQQIITIVQLHEPFKATTMGFGAPTKETEP